MLKTILLSVLLCAYFITQSSISASLEQQQFTTAYQLTKTGKPDIWQKAAKDLQSYPLYPYLEWSALGHQLSLDRADQVQKFLTQYHHSYIASELRTRWLRVLARHAHWSEFITAWEEEQNDISLQCYFIQAHITLKKTQSILPKALSLWVSGDSLPAACDGMIAWLRIQKQLQNEVIWQRIQNAALKNNIQLIIYLSKQLLLQDQAAAKQWAVTLSDPERNLQQIAQWPKHRLNQTLITIVFERLARKSHQRAGALWLQIASRMAWETTFKNRIEAAIAIQKAASYADDAGIWLEKAGFQNDNLILNEWHVRYNLAIQNEIGALRALEKMPVEQQQKARWRYTQARLLERQQKLVQAQTAYASIANQANFYGFLAAEHMQQPYRICSSQPVEDELLRTQVEHDPGLLRALELNRLGWKTYAQKEWDYTIAKMTNQQRYLAVAFAQQQKWVDRGPFTLLRPDDQTYYHLRFPVKYRKTIVRNAQQHDVDPALVFSLIRAESAWAVRAQSGANARGLMQLLPSVAAYVAKQEKIHYINANDLFRPTTNIQIGIAHLQTELEKTQNKVWLALAAYNAGPTPVKRWQSQRAALPADLWIETIPYYETREYVPRILAFHVIYDWLLNGDAGSLMQKLHLKSTQSEHARYAVQCQI